MNTEVRRITLDGARVEGWPGFHDMFSKAFGFPEYYGRNKDAWFECMSWLPGLTELTILNAHRLRSKWPDVHTFVIDACAEINFANAREGESGRIILALERW